MAASNLTATFAFAATATAVGVTLSAVGVGDECYLRVTTRLCILVSRCVIIVAVIRSITMAGIAAIW
ncbi:hypothetical protein V498_02589 [Pseudogymnoascus sp. VKM F-4517 (FW-2822)]|nr:hypothetical protein V498_02589 [Pseudogymnoascus sp. VKM F-4517 (FW-2822)]